MKSVKKKISDNKAGAPIGNTNAEVWTIEKANSLFEEAMSISKDKETYLVGAHQKEVKGFKYHYLGEIASELDLYGDLFTYLKDKFPELKSIYNSLKTRLESNCFSDSKKGIIKEATAIMNLKSNYGWTDRVDNTSGDQPIKQEKTTIVFKNFNGDSNT